MRYDNCGPVLAIACACGLALALVAAPAQAGVVLSIFGENEVMQNSWSDAINVAIDSETGAFDFQDGTSTRAVWEADEIYVVGNADPWVNFGFTIRNTAATVSNFTVNVFLPVIDSFSSTWTSGSVGITLIDANASGFAELTSTGSAPIYQSRLDGLDHVSLLAAPYALQVNTAGGGNNDEANFGVPGNTVPGGPLTSSMEVELKFSLSPGDRAVVFGTFVAVPEPSSFLLAALGFVALGWVSFSKRRRGATCSAR